MNLDDKLNKAYANLDDRRPEAKWENWNSGQCKMQELTRKADRLAALAIATLCLLGFSIVLSLAVIFAQS